MNKYHALATLVGMIVCAGYALDIPFIANPLPYSVSMKMTTALCFVAAAGVRTQALGLLSTLFVLSMMSVSLSSYYVGVSMGLEDPDGITATVAPGVPSLGTAACFLALLANVHLKKKALSWLMIAMGACGAVGAILDVGWLNYHVPAVSTGMAVHTGLGFVFWAVGDLVYGEEKTGS